MEFGDGRFRMTLAKGADTSTFFHEMMHMWTEVMGDLAQRPETPQQIKDDYQKLLDFSGYGTHENKVAMQAEALKIQQDAQGRDLTADESSLPRRAETSDAVLLGAQFLGSRRAGDQELVL